VIYQTCGKSPGLWTLYGVIVLQTLWNVDQPCKMVDYIRSCGLCILSNSVAEIAKYWQPFRKLPRLIVFIRSCDLCIISTTVLQNLPGLRTLYALATFVQYWPAFRNFTELMDFIRSVVLCIILASLTMSGLAAHQGQ
jgi:hypothetical protein